MILPSEVHELACDKGWWDGVSDPSDPMEVARALLMIHAEASEAAESVRNNEPHFWLGENGKPEGLGVELADIVIRVMDLAEACEINIDDMITLKHEYNKTRPHRHGGKLL